jgi:hypothetical protein
MYGIASRSTWKSVKFTGAFTKNLPEFPMTWLVVAIVPNQFLSKMPSFDCRDTVRGVCTVLGSSSWAEIRSWRGIKS